MHKKCKKRTLCKSTFVDEHTCNRSFVNSHVSAKWIVKAYVNKLRSNPQLPLSAFQEQIMADHKVTISRSKLHRAKVYAMKMVQGSLNKQYSLLPNYAFELERTNPGTTVQFVREGLDCHKFKRMYICLEACKRGFMEHCRRLIGMDGCHLKGPTHW